MNRNRKGELLTNDELLAIALEHDVMPEHKIRNQMAGIHSTNGIRSFLTDITAEVRFVMFGERLLKFGTEIHTPAPIPTVTVDAELVAYFTREES